MKWMTNITPLRWQYTAFCANEFGGEQFECNDNSAISCFLEGTDILSVLDLDRYIVEFAILMIVILLICIHIFAFLILLITTPTYMEVSASSGSVKPVNVDDMEMEQLLNV